MSQNLLPSNVKIVFISLNKEYIEIVQKHNFNGMVMRIQDYKPPSKTLSFYVSPANSFGFMDGGIDIPLSRAIMPGIDIKLKEKIRMHGKKNLDGREYLPVGSSIIVQHSVSKYLVSAPTMLLPQDVSNTKNSYYASMAVFYNVIINNKNLIKNKNVEIIFTSMCCGCGKMNVNESFTQTYNALKDFSKYKPTKILPNIIITEPNLKEQPNVYWNAKFKNI